MQKIRASEIKVGTEIRDPEHSRGYRTVENVQFGTAERWLSPNTVAVTLSSVREWVIFHTNQIVHTRNPTQRPVND